MSLHVLLLLSFITTVLSTCECGYSVTTSLAASANDTAPVSETYTFTQLLETDFLHVYTLPNYTTSTQSRIDVFDWLPQAYNVTPSEARGPYGKAADPANVIPNPLPEDQWGGPGSPGLQMWVRSAPLTISSQPYISIAEMSTVRSDMLYGSFRIGLQLPVVRGTCMAFFWYRNNTAEIDVEFLSREANDTYAPVNLVLQTPASAAAGYNAAGTPEFKVVPLPVQTGGWHELRFDWLPDSVTYFVDGEAAFSVTGEAVPSDPGHLIFNHWSNGDPGWSAGPPAQDAVATVSYVKAYFNSSLENATALVEGQCEIQPAGTKACAVLEPDWSVGIAPVDNDTGRTPFLSSDPGWTVADDQSAAMRMGVDGVLVLAVAGLAAGLML